MGVRVLLGVTVGVLLCCRVVKCVLCVCVCVGGCLWFEWCLLFVCVYVCVLGLRDSREICEVLLKYITNA